MSRQGLKADALCRRMQRRTLRWQSPRAALAFVACGVDHLPIPCFPKIYADIIADVVCCDTCLTLSSKLSLSNCLIITANSIYAIFLDFLTQSATGSEKWA